jgi:3-deoxy-D-manno-octulosonic-acid transferase
MHALYNLIISAYGVAIHLTALFLPKARLWVAGQKNWEQNLSSRVSSKEKWIWFHCSSLGEFEDCHEVLNEIKNRYQSHKFLLTFSSPSGYEVQKNTKVCDIIMYLPLDTPKNSALFLETLKPEIVFFSRSDLWYNYLDQIRERRIPAFLVSLYLFKKSGFLKWPVRGFYRKCFESFTHIFCQTESTRLILFKEFGVSSSSVTGNARIDRISQAAATAPSIPHIEKFVKNCFSIVVGSSEPKDEKIIFETYEKLRGLNLKWIIVPHEFETSNFDKMLRKYPGRIIRYSDIHSLKASQDLLFIDFVGSLKHLYKHASFSVVGGGFRKAGIHNIIEPAQYGVKVAFGPNHRSYTEALDLIELGAAETFRTSAELQKIILRQLGSQEANSLKSEIVNYVERNRGAGYRIAESAHSLAGH